MNINAILRIICFTATVLQLSASADAQLGQDKDDSCSGTNMGLLEGNFSTPGYPDKQYDPNLNCTYIIDAPVGSVVTYESLFMELEDPDYDAGLCMYDVLKIYDGDYLIRTICGREAIHLNATVTNRLILVFVTDYTNQAAGFSIRWKIVNPEDRPVSLDCNFDEAIPLCAGWTELLGDHPWKFTRGFTPSANTGPLRDHTTDSDAGRYAFFEASSVGKNNTAVLRSPPLRPKRKMDKRCLTFYYHMFGKGMGALVVKKVQAQGQTKVLDEFHSNMGDIWHRGQYQITIRSRTFIEFEGWRGKNYTSDMALDDISIREGDCSQDQQTTKEVTPGNCALGMELSDCQPDCRLSCDDDAGSNLRMGSMCTQTCLGGCACPAESPVFQDGKCIKRKECPGYHQEARRIIHDTLVSNIWKAIESALKLHRKKQN